jgi:UDP-2-acetamido-2-deoxy-ribo-hexuluronate aminotransferase
MSMPFIDLKPQYQALKSDIDARIQKILDHGQFIMGPEVEECEAALAKFLGAKHAITCSNGSDALQMAMMALGIGPGDEVITTAFSFIATAEMILMVGATPVMVDICPETYNIDWRKVEPAITPKTKAILAVSLYGQAADFSELQAIADQHGLHLIEDAAQSFGAPYKGRRSGALTEISGTSFFPAKPLGCYGDGGAIFTSNDDWAKTLKSIRMHGMGEHRYQHVRLGINGRLDTIQCAVVTAKLKRYPAEIDLRQQVADRYTAAFSDLREYGLRTPIVRPDRQSVWAQYSLQITKRTELQDHLKNRGVPTAIHYPLTMADQPHYRDKCVVHDVMVARKAAAEVMSLPMYPDMTVATQDQVVSAVRSFFKGH